MKKQIIQHTAKLVAFFVAIGFFSIVFGTYIGAKLAHEFYQRPPSRTRQTDVSAIRGWMTLTYVARTYGTPEPELEKSLKLEPGKYHRWSLSQIAQEIGQTETQLIQNVQETVTAFQATHQNPPK